MRRQRALRWRLAVRGRSAMPCRRAAASWHATELANPKQFTSARITFIVGDVCGSPPSLCTCRGNGIESTTPIMLPSSWDISRHVTTMYPREADRGFQGLARLHAGPGDHRRSTHRSHDGGLREMTLYSDAEAQREGLLSPSRFRSRVGASLHLLQRLGLTRRLEGHTGTFGFLSMCAIGPRIAAHPSLPSSCGRLREHSNLHP